MPPDLRPPPIGVPNAGEARAERLLPREPRSTRELGGGGIKPARSDRAPDGSPAPGEAAASGDGPWGPSRPSPVPGDSFPPRGESPPACADPAALSPPSSTSVASFSVGLAKGGTGLLKAPLRPGDEKRLRLAKAYVLGAAVPGPRRPGLNTPAATTPASCFECLSLASLSHAGVFETTAAGRPGGDADVFSPEGSGDEAFSRPSAAAVAWPRGERRFRPRSTTPPSGPASAGEAVSESAEESASVALEGPFAASPLPCLAAGQAQGTNKGENKKPEELKKKNEK